MSHKTKQLTDIQLRMLAALSDKPITIRALYYVVYPGKSILGRDGAGRRSVVARGISALVKAGLAIQIEDPNSFNYTDWFVYKRLIGA